jgi:hypothetical protein
MVMDQAAEVCNDKLIVAPTNPSVTFANDTLNDLSMTGTHPHHLLNHLIYFYAMN